LLVFTDVVPCAGPDATVTDAGTSEPSESLSLARTSTVVALPWLVVALSLPATGMAFAMMVSDQPPVMVPDRLQCHPGRTGSRSRWAKQT
jgi:hypothetical protein